MAGILKSSLAAPGAPFPLDGRVGWRNSSSFSRRKSRAKRGQFPPLRVLQHPELSSSVAP